jgi:hypothetical protein
MSLAMFLQWYAQALVELRALAARRAIPLHVVAHALVSNPYALPVALNGVLDASSIRRLLESALVKRAFVTAAPVDVDRALAACIHAVLVNGADPTSLFGNTAAVEVQRAASTHSAHALPPSIQRMERPVPPPAPPLQPTNVPPSAPSASAPLSPSSTSVADSPASTPDDRGSASQPALPAGTSGSPDTYSSPTPRWISAEIDDHAPSEALDPEGSYTVAIGVDTKPRANAVGTSAFDDTLVFGDGIEEVELTVDLTSDDFEITPINTTFKVRRTGQGPTRARFELRPRREGLCSITAIVHKQCNFVQSLTFSVAVGNAIMAAGRVPETISISRPQSVITGMQSRSVMLVLTPSTGGGYDLMARDERGLKLAHLPVERAELQAAITSARDGLLKVVDYQRAGDTEPLFQNSIDIDSTSSDAALRIMARSGARLFQVLFRHHDGSDDATRVGTWLAALRGDDDAPLSIQVMSRDAPIPWGMLYVGDASAASLDWQQFLGFRHVIEQLPMVDQLGQGGPTISSNNPGLHVSINLNRNIDRQMRAPFVADQEAYWATTSTAHPSLHVVVRVNKTDVVSALASAETDDQIAYFYCHAETTAIDATGGVDASSLWLTDDGVTLEELNIDASTEIKLRGNPLVFINACESAELSPLFYGGFVPYFLSKGARGVIGTECRTPGNFAAEWAARFFPRFLGGESIGPLFLALRREFLQAHRNPLGLLYAVYCDGDTAIVPSL